MGHPGQRKTRSIVGNLFYWPGMVAEIDEYVRTCSTCQLSKHSNTATAGKQVPLPISRGPFEDIAIDFVGPIRPVTERGNRYLVTIVCRLTKFAFAKPLKDIEAKTIVPVVQSYFMSYGIPKTLLSDNGTNLRSREFEELLTKYQVHHLYTSIETPSTNGQNEGYNRILITALRARQSVHDWDL